MAKRKEKRFVWFAKRTIHYIFLGIYKITYGLYISKRYRLKISPDSDYNVKPPYLLLANHCNNLDGWFLQCILSKPINFVVTDSMFKYRSLGGLLSVVGYIPKKKFVSDIKAIRQIIRTTRNGGIIGLFPEGRRSWDGKTVHIQTPTYRLIQMLKVPVVTAKIMGAYLSDPRWATTKRRGLVEVKLKTILDEKSLASMTLSEIEEKITAALDHNEFDWQRIKNIPYKGKELAKGFERLLFVCPECKNIGTMDSASEKIWCTSCGAEYFLDQYGYIHSTKGYLPTENIIDLNKWQIEQLKLSFSLLKKAEDVLLCDKDAHLASTCDTKEHFKDVESGNLTLTNNELTIGSFVFNLDDIYGISVHFKSQLTFRYKSCDYRIRFTNRRVSPYKWFSALGLIRDGIKEAF